MAKIKIITDSGSDITVKRAQKLGIRVVPISYTFDGETYYKDGVDLAPDEFYTKLAQSEGFPKTAQITPAQFEDVFNEEFDNGYDTLIVVTLSSNASGIYQNAVMMANSVTDERGGEIIVIDSQGYSCMYGALVVHAAKMLQNGSSKEEITAYLNEALPTMHAYFLVGDLAHLKKGGRINAATLVVANMLDIKPVLTIDGGLVVQKEKIRGSKKLLKKLTAIAEDDGFDLSGKNAVVVHSLQYEKKEELQAELEAKFESIKVMDCVIGAVIACHAGPDLVGFVFSDKIDISDYED